MLRKAFQLSRDAYRMERARPPFDNEYFFDSSSFKPIRFLRNRMPMPDMRRRVKDIHFKNEMIAQKRYPQDEKHAIITDVRVGL